jgi:ankyrin repeat protein
MLECLNALERLNAFECLNIFRHLNTHRSNQYEVVELLLHNKCDPNICNKDGQSPLYVAAEQRNMKVIILLLQGNANPNLQAY